jgi:hypothetical protein
LWEKARVNEQQFTALQHSLKCPFNFINGAPGTGKKHLSKELIGLMADFKSTKGPILVISFKNYALIHCSKIL